MKIAFFDFEATDKDPETCRITQLAVSIYNEKGKELYHYSSLVYDESYPQINETAAAITGLSLEQLKDYGISPGAALTHFNSVANGCDFLCAHNLRGFDWPLLSAECARLGLIPPVSPCIDTRYDLPYPNHIETRKLLYLAAEYGFANPMAHSARHDVDAMAYLFFKFDLDTIITRSQSPELWLRADVKYDDRQLAKDRKFMWDGDQKIWVKKVKELDINEEITKAKFPILTLKNYKGPKTS